MASLVMALALGPAAAAGGPTSVVLTQPGSAETTALHYSREEYAQLEKLLGDTGSGKAGSLEPPPGVSVGMGEVRQITATWLIHDVQPWRVDRIYASPKDGSPLWIHSATDWKADRLVLERGVWHKAKAPDALRGLLKRLGVMGEPSADGGAMVPWPGTAESPEASESGSESAGAVRAGDEAGTGAAGAAAVGSSAAAGWWWAGPGLVVGLLLGAVVASRVRWGRWGALPDRTRESGPRQQVLEL